MYTLYHHFLQKVKQQQIERYNKKHRAYLIRSGKLIIQQNKPEISRNQRSQGNRQNMRDIRNKVQKIDNAEQVPPVDTKPKRQRQFNRPNRNQQKEVQKQTKTTIRNQNFQQAPIRPAKNNHKPQSFEQEVPNKIVQQKRFTNHEIDRPIKQNKLTQQQIQYLNQQKSRPIPQSNKPSNQNQNRAPVQQPPLPTNVENLPISIKDKKERPLNENKMNLDELEQQYTQVQLIECPTCGRKFREKAFQKHENVCQKVFLQKRKPFQVKATDQQAQLLKKKSKITKKSEIEKKQAKQAKWKRQSQTFQNMIKRGRGQKVQVVQIDTRIQCPGCGRKFAEGSVARHIQFCTKKKKK